MPLLVKEWVTKPLSGTPLIPSLVEAPPLYPHLLHHYLCLKHLWQGSYYLYIIYGRFREKVTWGCKMNLYKLHFISSHSESHDSEFLDAEDGYIYNGFLELRTPISTDLAFNDYYTSKQLP